MIEKLKPMLDELPANLAIMLSGGMDSVALTYLLKPVCPGLRGVCVNYGQRSYLMTRRVNNWLSHALNVPVENIEVPRLVDSFLGFMEDEYDGGLVIMCEAKQSVGVLYEAYSGFVAVSSIAATWTETIGWDGMAVGYNKSDREGDPERYIHSKLVHEKIAEALTIQRNRPFNIYMPFWDIDKADILTWAVQEGIAMEKTWSCWGAGPKQCGQCAGCSDRKEVYARAKITDPTIYAH